MLLIRIGVDDLLMKRITFGLICKLFFFFFNIWKILARTLNEEWNKQENLVERHAKNWQKKTQCFVSWIILGIGHWEDHWFVNF